MKTHHTANIDTNGTYLQGYVKVGYDKLREVFGLPMLGGCSKVDWEWNIQCEDGTVATIYNWKNGPAYGYDGVAPWHISEWNIGGFNKQALIMVRKMLAG